MRIGCLANGFEVHGCSPLTRHPLYTHRAPTTKQLAVSINRTQIHLFNITADPNEEANVAAAYPGVVAKMHQRLAYLAETANGYVPPQDNKPYPQGLYVLHNGTWAPFLKATVDYV